MIGSYRREWDGDEWQSYCFRLVRLRHGAANVQRVPDRVRGDAGIDCFTLDGCGYQCYAPEETSDTKKAASAMKRKGSRDLAKLKTNASIIQDLLRSMLRRWVLFVPFLDDKDVVICVREKGEALKSAGVSFIAEEFEAIVHSQEDFSSEIHTIRAQPITPNLEGARTASGPALDLNESKLGRTLLGKLRRAYPELSADVLGARGEEHLKAHAGRENILSVLKARYPILWDRTIACIDAEEKKLAIAGATGTAPVEVLNGSLARIEESLGKDLPDLARSAITELSVGTLSDWLMRCPLDFTLDIES